MDDAAVVGGAQGPRQANRGVGGATGLEWTTASPPPQHNFAEQPVVTREAYEYPHPKDEG